MEPTVEELRKNYEHFDDNKLIRIATTESSSLRPDALEVLREVIRERGLSQDVLRGMDAQLTPVNVNSLEAYAELLRNQPCPICNSTNEKLNATQTGTVMSFIIFTNYRKVLKVACPLALTKKITRLC